MNYANETLNAISALRLSFLKEKAAICEKYTKELKEQDKKIDAASRADYHSDIILLYKSSLDQILQFAKKYADMRGRAPKLSFDFKKALDTTPHRAFTRGGVDSYVKKLEDEAILAVKGLSDSKTVEDDERLLKSLASVVSDLKYIVENARRLLDESGIPEARKEEALAPLKNRLGEIKDEYAEALKLENMHCYGKIVELRGECLSIIDRAEKEKIGAYKPSPKEKLSVLIGYEKNEIAVDDADFISEILGISPDALSATPIYYCPEDRGGAIVINAHEDFFNTQEFADILENIFFGFISNLPKGCLKMTGIDCGLTPQIASLARFAASVSANIEAPAVLSEMTNVSQFLSSLFSEGKSRRLNIKNIFDYNRKQAHSPEAFKLVYANEYPSGFSGYREPSKVHVLKYLSEYCAAVGVIPIICQDADSNAFDAQNAPRFTEEDAAIFIDLTEKDSVKINRREATLDVRCEGFFADDYWERLSDYYNSTQDIFYLDEVLMREDVVDTPLYPSFNIDVPLGVVDDKTFKYRFKAGSIEHMLILGGSDRGKSSLLHALILGMSYCYTPEEVEFYLADFKVGDSSPEFSNYEKIDGEANLYVPHIKYLLSRCAPQDAIDMFATIKNLYEQRTKFILSHDANDYCSYHERNAEKIKNGILPKIPMTFFIIDEYHRLVEAAEEDGDLAERIIAAIKGLIDTIRSAGIALVLVDQDMKRVTSSIFGNGNNMPNRIIIGEMEEQIIKRFFYPNALSLDKEIARDIAYLSDLSFKGRMMIGDSQSHTNLRVAYVGKASSDKARTLAAKIRDKYSRLQNGEERICHQVLGGSEKKIRITEDFESYRIAHEHKETTKLSIAKFDDFSIAIGVSSAGGVPIRVEFEGKPNKGPGYSVFAGEECLAAINRNAVFAFLYRTAGHYNYRRARVEYCAKPSDVSFAFGLYQDQIKRFSSCVNLTTKFVEMSRVILGLAKLYDEREAYADEAESTDFEPILLVVHNADWIGKPKSLPSVNSPVEKKEVSIDFGLKSDIDEQNDILKDAGLGDVMLSPELIGGLLQSENEEKTNYGEFEHFTASQLKEALKKLYMYGNRYNIYVLLGSQEKSVIENLFSDDGRAFGKELVKHRIFVNDNDSDVSEFCRVTTSQNKEGSKTRLYDYDPDTEGEFWKELNEKLNGELL